MKTPRYLTVERLGFALLVLATTGALYSLYTALHQEEMLTIAVRQGVESVALKKVAERFSREHGLTVKIEELPYDELFEQERKQLSEKHSIFDVIMVDDPWMPALLIDPTDTDGNDHEKYRLTKLDQKTYEQDYGLTDFAKSALDVASYCAVGDFCANYYGVPFVGNSQIFCYNVDDIQDPASIRDWDQVKRTSKKLQAPNKLGYVTRIGPNNSIVTDFMPILWAYENEEDPRDRFAVFANGKEKEDNLAFQTMVELVTNQKAGGISVDDFDVAAYLSTGHASMGIVWSAWAMSLINIQNTRDALQDQRDSQDQQNAQTEHKRPTLKCAGMPGGKPELGVWLLAIPMTSTRANEAEEFIKYATSREQLLIAAAQGNPPPRKSVLKNLPAPTEKNDAKTNDAKTKDAKTKDVQNNNQGKDSQNLDCSSRLMPKSDYYTCMARVHKVIDRYGDLFKLQEDSLEAARPRPRSRCWTEIEKVLGNHLQELIISPPKNPQLLSQAADAAVSQAAVSQAKQELDSLNKKRCWEFKPDTSHYH